MVLGHIQRVAVVLRIVGIVERGGRRGRRRIGPVFVSIVHRFSLRRVVFESSQRIGICVTVSMRGGGGVVPPVGVVAIIIVPGIGIMMVSGVRSLVMPGKMCRKRARLLLHRL